MRRLNLSAAAAALFLAFALPSSLFAQAVTCKDGTSASGSGRGACSHHGGVASVVLTVSCRDGSAATPGRGACSHHGGVGTATATRTRSSSSTRARASESTTQPSSAPSHSGGGETVSCRDGTTSASRRGACSHHGGVGPASSRSSTRSDTRATRAEAPNASANDGESVGCRDGTTSTAGRGACSHHGGVNVASAPGSTTETRSAREIPPPAPPAPGAPADASARCNDGTYSNTQHRSGACSHHGGVKEWYKDLPVRWY